MADNNTKNIEKILYDALRNQDFSQKFENLQTVQTQLKQYLTLLDNTTQILAKNIENDIQNLEKDGSITAVRYGAVKSLVKHGYALDEILKDGYRYIDVIRYAFTGQRIEYLIGTMKGNVLVERIVSLEEILNNSTLDIETKSSYANTAKLKITKTPDLTSTNNSYEPTMVQVTENASSVFSAVYNYFHASLGETPKINKGNAYETYRTILAQRNNNNRIPPSVTIEEIEQAYANVKSNTLPFYKGGDIGNIQVKYFGGSAPSLVTTASIKRIISKTIQIIDNIINASQPNNKIATAVANLFVAKEKHISNKIEEEARNEALKELNILFNTDFKGSSKF